MPTLNEIRREFNSLVPAAQAAGIRVRAWGAVPTTAQYGLERIARLRSQLGLTTSLTQTAPVGTFPPPLPLPAGLPSYTFGVEFEFIPPAHMAAGFINPQRQLAQLISNAGVQTSAETYNHQLRNHWKIVTDSSVPGGLELVSPILQGEAGIAAMRTACDVLVAAGCTINRTCGFHVHVGARALPVSTFKNILRLYAHYHTAIDSVLAPSRRAAANPTYCRPVRHNPSLDGHRTMDTFMRNFREPRTRYQAVNLNAFIRHGTIEFRQHGGTIEADKAEQWVRLCLRMVARADASAMMQAPAGFALSNLLEFVGASEPETSFFIARAERFASRAATTLNT